MLNLFQHLGISKKVRFDKEGCAIVSLQVERRNFHCSGSLLLLSFSVETKDHKYAEAGTPGVKGLDSRLRGEAIVVEVV